MWKAAVSVINHLNSFTFDGILVGLGKKNKKQLSDIFMRMNFPIEQESMQCLKTLFKEKLVLTKGEFCLMEKYMWIIT